MAVQESLLGALSFNGQRCTALKIFLMHESIADAEAHGTRVMNEGGGTAAGPLIFPALLYPVQAGMKLRREEQFGPVMPVARFAQTGEAIQSLIDSDHDQQDCERAGRQPFEHAVYSLSIGSRAECNETPYRDGTECSALIRCFIAFGGSKNSISCRRGQHRRRRGHGLVLR